MDLSKFEETLPALWATDPQHADHPIDRRFGEIIETTDGMATENKIALLSHAAGHLGDDEVFLEIGTYKATSIIGASDGLPDRSFVTVDNFSEFNGPRAECLANLERYGRDNVRLIERDGFDVLRSGGFGKVGVYFYDGRHRYMDQWAALALVVPHLADEAVVIVDDTGNPAVQRATRRFVEQFPSMRKIALYESAFNGEPRWWNGVDVYGYRRTAGEVVPTVAAARRPAFVEDTVKPTLLRWMPWLGRVRRAITSG